jgi:transcriptional regulator with XRE-family HTH domain
MAVTANPKIASPADQQIGLRICALRRARGLSQTALGNEIGVTFQQVQKYEKGVNRVSGGRLERIANFLEVETADLFGSNGGKPSRGGPTIIDKFMADHYGGQIAAAYLRIEDRAVQKYVAQFIITLARSRARKT